MALAMIASIEALMEAVSRMEPSTPPEALTTAAWRCLDAPLTGCGLNSRLVLERSQVAPGSQPQAWPDGHTMPCTVICLPVLLVGRISERSPKNRVNVETASQLLPAVSVFPPVPQLLLVVA